MWDAHASKQTSNLLGVSSFYLTVRRLSQRFCDKSQKGSRVRHLRTRLAQLAILLGTFGIGRFSTPFSPHLQVRDRVMHSSTVFCAIHRFLLSSCFLRVSEEREDGEDKAVPPLVLSLVQACAACTRIKAPLLDGLVSSPALSVSVTC